MNPELSIAFIGGGNMAWALANGLADKTCSANRIHVVEINEESRARWQARGMSVSAQPDAALRAADIWIYAVKPQSMREVVAATQPFLGDDTLVVSIAAGIRGETLAEWLGQSGKPWHNLVRSMPNTPALVGAGVTGVMAFAGVSDADRLLVEQIFTAVGDVVWVADDVALDAVTALSGSGPAYVFLFLESLISGAQALGLPPEQARQLALGTLAGATHLARESDDAPGVLREKVTSKGGTTAAALDVFGAAGFSSIVHDAMKAACTRSAQLADDAAKS